MLQIVVETIFIHPHFGGEDIKTKLFRNFESAEAYYLKLKEEEKKFQYQNTTIRISHVESE
jgi:5S rRNA maturation endonuclease (ribonuclease M5)